MTPPTPELDAAGESFLALLAARRAPKTVEAYRRDLLDFTVFLGRPPTDASGDASDDAAGPGSAGAAGGGTASPSAETGVVMRRP